MATIQRPMTTEERLFRCWTRGDSIRTTIRSVREYCGIDLTFEQVRLAFVDLADTFKGAGHG